MKKERKEKFSKFKNRKTHILRKLVTGLTIAEIAGLAAAFLITFLVVKPSMEEETLTHSQEDGEKLAQELDIVLDGMLDNMDFLCSSEMYAEAFEMAMEGDCSQLYETLDNLVAMESFDICLAAAYTDSLGWICCDGQWNEGDVSALDFMSISNLSSDNLGPVVANIYTSEEENDRICMGMALEIEDGTLWKVVLLFDSSEIKEIITNALINDYTGFEIGKVNGPGFFPGGDSSNAHEILAEYTDEGNYVVQDEEGYYVITQTSYNWRICGYISNKDFASTYLPTLRNMILICLLMFAVALAIIIPLSRRMLKPIKTLKNAMSEAAEGNLDVRADIKTNDEFYELGEYFNNMLPQIKAHTEDAVKLEASEQNLRYSLLLSQVNYHFIYNAMSTINSLARKQDYESIIRLNSALAKILQGNMALEDSRMTCTLEEELDLTRNYWEIEQISKKGTASLNINCPESLNKAVVPKNVLQPVVENCVRHGLVDPETGRLKGRVDISVFKEDIDLVLEVSDNGRGIDPETLKNLQEGSEIKEGGRHIGIANIRKRLEYLYGDKASLEIESGPSGTIVTIRLPLDIP